MDNISHSQHIYSEKCCSFCLSPNEEVRLILRATIIRLRRMHERRKFPDSVSNYEMESGKNPIQRLIRVLFDKNTFELKMAKLCPHTKLLNLLLQKIKCKNYQLQTLIDQLCDSIARRNYQLEVITVQVKNVENSALDQEILDEEPSLQPKKVTAESEVSQQKQSAEKLVKVELIKKEEIQLQKKFEQEGSPATNLSYHVSFDNIPYAYNYLFYGGAFYP